MHGGEGGCVYMEGVECVCIREREDVCMRKGLSVRAWERMCVYGGLYVHGEREDEGVECACMGRGREKGWSVPCMGTGRMCY